MRENDEAKLRVNHLKRYLSLQVARPGDNEGQIGYRTYTARNL